MIFRELGEEPWQDLGMDGLPDSLRLRGHCEERVGRLDAEGGGLQNDGT